MNVLCMHFYVGRSDDCPHGTVRLTGNNLDDDSGYVEVCVGGSYTGVCAIDWSDEDAQVVCRQLGKTVEGSMQLYDAAWVVPSTTTVTEFLCVGNESHLVECGFSQLPTGGCAMTSAGVRCGGKCRANTLLHFTEATQVVGVSSATYACLP